MSSKSSVIELIQDGIATFFMKKSAPEGRESKTESVPTSSASLGDQEEIMDIEPMDEVPAMASGATMAQLIAKAVPDADIHCSNVIISGSQSAGKTKMIISMVFHHLVENEVFSDEMGDKLLKLFRTGGERMVTRRPMKISLVKTAAGSACKIWLQFGGKFAAFAEPAFDEIIDAMQQESLDVAHQAFAGELCVTIAAPGLPNVKFTDLPGLTAADRNVVDEEGVTIRKLVEKYVKLPDTTLVVVEPALAHIDLANSQVAHLISVVNGEARADIFANAVLVLSKCDTIRNGQERNLMNFIGGTSDQLQQYPFQHVVGVINKITEGSSESDEQESTFAAFREIFRATKAFEQKFFSELRGPGGTTCDPLSQCSTAAVFSKIDQITFRQVHRSIGKGLDALSTKVKQVKAQIRRECAPPLTFYDQAASAIGGEPRGRASLLDESRAALLRAVVDRSKDLQLDDSVCEEVVDLWPAAFACGDLSTFLQQETAIEKIRSRLAYFLQGVVLPCVFDEVHKPAGTSFHRIDRFPKLIEAWHTALLETLPDCRTAAMDAINAYLQQFWDFEVPKGVAQDQMPAFLEQLKHVALMKVFTQLRALSKGEVFDAMVQNDALLEETALSTENRSQLRERWESLHRQEAILKRCKAVENNEDLRATLIEAYNAQQGVQYTSEEEWLQFWREAEYSFVVSGPLAPHEPVARKRKRSVAADGSASQSSFRGSDFTPVEMNSGRDSPTQFIRASAESPQGRPKAEKSPWQPSQAVLSAIEDFGRYFESTGIVLTKTSPIPKFLEKPLRELDLIVLSQNSLALLKTTFGYHELLQEVMGGEVSTRKIGGLLTRLRLRDKAATCRREVDAQVALFSQELRRAAVRYDDLLLDANPEQAGATQPAWVYQWTEESKKKLRDLMHNVKHWVSLENQYRERLTQHDKKDMLLFETLPLDADIVVGTYTSKVAAALPDYCLHGDLDVFHAVLFEEYDGVCDGANFDEPAEEMKDDLAFD